MNKTLLFVIVVLGQTSMSVVCKPGSYCMEEVSTHQQKEVIDDRTFEYFQKNINGTTTEQWFIDGQEVSYQDYVEAITQAEHAMIRARRAHEREVRRFQQEMLSSVQKAGHKKMLELTCAQVQEYMQRIYANKLDVYLTDVNTNPYCKQFENLTKNLLPQAELLLGAPDNAYSLDEYKNMIAQLDPAPQWLQRVFYTTVQDAIQQCNDTKQLKELLEMSA